MIISFISFFMSMPFIAWLFSLVIFLSIVLEIGSHIVLRYRGNNRTTKLAVKPHLSKLKYLIQWAQQVNFQHAYHCFHCPFPFSMLNLPMQIFLLPTISDICPWLNKSQKIGNKGHHLHDGDTCSQLLHIVEARK